MRQVDPDKLVRFSLSFTAHNASIVERIVGAQCTPTPGLRNIVGSSQCSVYKKWVETGSQAKIVCNWTENNRNTFNEYYIGVVQSDEECIRLAKANDCKLANKNFIPTFEFFDTDWDGCLSNAEISSHFPGGFSETCADEAGWVDPISTNGATCDSWTGFAPCNWDREGYSPASVVQAKCPKTCGLCVPLAGSCMNKTAWLYHLGQFPNTRLCQGSTSTCEDSPTSFQSCYCQFGFDQNANIDLTSEPWRAGWKVTSEFVQAFIRFPILL